MTRVAGVYHHFPSSLPLPLPLPLPPINQPNTGVRACVSDPPKSEYPVEPRQSTLPNSYFTACARSSGVFRPRSDILSYPILSYPFLVRSRGAPPYPPSSSGFGHDVLQGHPRVYQRFYDVCRPAPGPLLLFITVAPWRGALIRAGLMKVAADGFRRVRSGGISRSTVFGRPNSLADFSSVVLFGQGGRRETRFLLGFVREAIRSFLLFFFSSEGGF